MKELSPGLYSLEREPVFQEAFGHLLELQADLDMQWQRACDFKRGIWDDGQGRQKFTLANQARGCDQHMQKYLKELCELDRELEVWSREIDELRDIREVFAEGIGTEILNP